jgi:5-methylcytosine-specific restriction enzyme A
MFTQMLQDRFRGIRVARSSGWGKVEKEKLILNPSCQACSSKKKLNAHHIRPFHLFPKDELLLSNLITLCRRCHEFLGHLDDWKSYNECCTHDAMVMLAQIKGRPK